MIPDLVKNTAIALTGGDETAIEQAEEDPFGYMEGFMANALSSEEGMKQLEKRLQSVGLLNEQDQKAFEKFMALGLTADERAAMAASIGGKGLLGLSGIMGLLAYLSWKKSQEGGQPQMG